MSNEITVDKEFFEHLLNCMEEQKGNYSNSQGRYVGAREPIQEKINAAYHKARALLSQDSQGNASEDVHHQLLGQQLEYASKDANASQAKEPFNYQEDPIPGHTYTLTWDPAMKPCFSVITVVDRDAGYVAAFDYDNQADDRSQIISALTLAYKYNNASIVIDPTGIGALLFDQLRELGIPVKAIYKHTERIQDMSNEQETDTAQSSFRRFKLVRTIDITGISGVGDIAVGVQWPDQSATLFWLKTETNGYYKGIDQLRQIHCYNDASGQSNARVEWMD